MGVLFLLFSARIKCLPILLTLNRLPVSSSWSSMMSEFWSNMYLFLELSVEVDLVKNKIKFSFYIYYAIYIQNLTISWEMNFCVKNTC